MLQGKNWAVPPLEQGVRIAYVTSVVGLSLSITSKKICIEFVTLSSVSTWMGDRNAPTSNENVKSCIDLAG